MTETTTYATFAALQILAGTVVRAEAFPEAMKPAIKLWIDLGVEGVKTSSAQIVDLYSPEELNGTQVIVVANFPPRRIAGFNSECLVLGVVQEGKGVVLLRPDKPVADGSVIL